MKLLAAKKEYGLLKNEQKNVSTNCAGYGEDAITSYRLH